MKTQNFNFLKITCVFDRSLAKRKPKNLNLAKSRNLFACMPCGTKPKFCFFLNLRNFPFGESYANC